jgi:hypothetical protein
MNKYPRLAVYNTGFGLAISEEDGPEIPAWARHDFLKIKAPDSDLPGEVWDHQWTQNQKVAEALVDALNEKNGYEKITYDEHR